MGRKGALEIRAELSKLDEIRQFVKSSAEIFKASDHTIDDLQLAVVEAATNIILHGYKQGPGMLEISVEQESAALIVKLRDQAPQFDPCSYAVPALQPLPERTSPGGFGIRLIKEVMDEVSYSPLDSGGNELTLVKHLANQ